MLKMIKPGNYPGGLNVIIRVIRGRQEDPYEEWEMHLWKQEMGIMQLQTKDCQPPPDTEKGKEWILPWSLQKEPVCKTHFELLIFRTKTINLHFFKPLSVGQCVTGAVRH